MGMFDSVTFKYQMPDGFEGCDFQTKDLASETDEYEVTAAGRLIRTFAGYHNQIGDIEYDGRVTLTSTSNSHRVHGYTLVFKAGDLVLIECHQTNSTLPFEKHLAHRAER